VSGQFFSLLIKISYYDVLYHSKFYNISDLLNKYRGVPIDLYRRGVVASSTLQSLSVCLLTLLLKINIIESYRNMICRLISHVSQPIGLT